MNARAPYLTGSGVAELLSLGLDGGVVRKCDTHVESHLPQRSRQRSADVGKATDLDQRRHFGDDEEYAGGHNRSIAVGWETTEPASADAGS